MIIAALADVHAADDLPMSKILPTGFSDRLLDIDACLREALSADVDMVVICGDLFHKRLLDAPTALVITRTLSKDWGKHIYVIPGNHDAHDAGGRHYNVNYIGAAKKTGITVVSQPLTVKFDEADLSFMPYLPEKMAKQKLKELKGDILFCHQTIAGCKQGGWTSKSGLTIKDYGHFNQVIAGHFHEQQQFDKGCYLGSLTQLAWTETHKKGYWLMDVTSGRAELNLVEVANTPVFFTMTMDHRPSKDEIVTMLEAQPPDSYIQLIITADKQEVPQLKIDLNEVEKELPENIRALRTIIDSPQDNKPRSRGQIAITAQSLEGLMRDYVEADPNIGSSTNKQDLLSIGNNILEEARP